MKKRTYKFTTPRCIGEGCNAPSVLNNKCAKCDDDWREATIPGQTWRYQINSRGVLRRPIAKNHRKQHKWRYLYGGLNHGYVEFILFGNIKVSQHRLLAINFIPNPDNLPQVNHINGITNDNRLENLEWCTHQYNVQHSFDTGLNHSGEDHALSKISNKHVHEILDVYLNNPRESRTVVGKKYGIDNSTVQNILTGIRRRKVTTEWCASKGIEFKSFVDLVGNANKKIMQ